MKVSIKAKVAGLPEKNPNITLSLKHKKRKLVSPSPDFMKKFNIASKE